MRDLPAGLRAALDRKHALADDTIRQLIDMALGDLRAAADSLDAWGSMTMRVADLLDEADQRTADAYAMALIAAAVLRLAEVERDTAPVGGESRTYTVRPRPSWVSLTALEALWRETGGAA